MLKTPTSFKLYAVKPLYHLKIKSWHKAIKMTYWPKGQDKKNILNLLILFFIKKDRKSISYLVKKCFKHKNIRWKDLFSKTILLQYDTSSLVFFHKQSKGQLMFDVTVISPFKSKGKSYNCTSCWKKYSLILD